MVCAVKAIPSSRSCSDSFSVERRKLSMRALGAKVILTPAAERGTGMVKKAEDMAKKNGCWFLRDSSRTKLNPDYHLNTTAPNPARFRRQNLDYWVTATARAGH